MLLPPGLTVAAHDDDRAGRGLAGDGRVRRDVEARGGVPAVAVRVPAGDGGAPEVDDAADVEHDRARPGQHRQAVAQRAHRHVVEVGVELGDVIDGAAAPAGDAGGGAVGARERRQRAGHAAAGSARCRRVPPRRRCRRCRRCRHRRCCRRGPRPPSPPPPAAPAVPPRPTRRPAGAPTGSGRAAAAPRPDAPPAPEAPAAAPPRFPRAPVAATAARAARSRPRRQRAGRAPAVPVAPAAPPCPPSPLVPAAPAVAPPVARRAAPPRRRAARATAAVELPAPARRGGERQRQRGQPRNDRLDAGKRCTVDPRSSMSEPREFDRKIADVRTASRPTCPQAVITVRSSGQSPSGKGQRP